MTMLGVLIVIVWLAIAWAGILDALDDGLADGEVEPAPPGAEVLADGEGEIVGAAVAVGLGEVIELSEGEGEGSATGVTEGAALSIGAGSLGNNSAAIVRANCEIKRSATKPINAFRRRRRRSLSIVEKDNFSIQLIIE